MIDAGSAAELLLEPERAELSAAELRELTRWLKSAMALSWRQLLGERGNAGSGARAWHRLVDQASEGPIIVCDGSMGSGTRGRLRSGTAVPGAGDYLVISQPARLCLVVSHEYPDIGPELWSARA